MNRVEVAVPVDQALHELLKGHPHVEFSDKSRAVGWLTFWQDGRERHVLSSSIGADVFGLTELMDNNPIVCADRVGVPSPLGTLALIALGPLARAGIIADEPTILSSFEADIQGVEEAMASIPYDLPVGLHWDRKDLGSVLAATCFAEVVEPDDWSDIDALYNESFARSFFVRHIQEGDWDTKLVSGTPWAAYRYRVNPDSPRGLIEIQVMADMNGKCGAAQALHVFNLMCGFEESLGLQSSSL